MQIILRSIVAMGLIGALGACGKTQFTDNSQKGNSLALQEIDKEPAAETQGGAFDPPTGASVFLEGDQVLLALPLLQTRPVAPADTDEDFSISPQHIAFFDDGSGRFIILDESLVDFSHLLVKREKVPEMKDICPKGAGAINIYDGTADIKGEKALVSITDISGSCNPRIETRRRIIFEDEEGDDEDNDSEGEDRLSSVKVACFAVQIYARQLQCTVDSKICPIQGPTIGQMLFFEKEKGGCEAIEEFGFNIFQGYSELR